MSWNISKSPSLPPFFLPFLPSSLSLSFSYLIILSFPPHVSFLVTTTLFMSKDKLAFFEVDISTINYSIQISLPSLPLFTSSLHFHFCFPMSSFIRGMPHGLMPSNQGDNTSLHTLLSPCELTDIHDQWPPDFKILMWLVTHHSLHLLFTYWFVNLRAVSVRFALYPITHS